MANPAASARCALAILLALATSPSHVAVAADPAPPAHDPNLVQLAFADDEWLVWIDGQLIEATRQHRAQSFVRTYSIQRVGQATTRAVVRTRGTHAHDVVAVLADGTLALNYSTTLHWARADGPEPVALDPRAGLPLTFEGRRQRILRGSTRGFFVQAYDQGSEHPVCFVPLDGRELRWDRRARVTREAVPVSMPPYPQLEGDLACCGRSVLDLATGVRREIPMEGFSYARALGSGYVAGFSQLVRLEDGRQTPLPNSRGGYQQVFAIRHGLAYAVRALAAMDGEQEGTLSVLALDPTGAAATTTVAEARAANIVTSFATLEHGRVTRHGPITLVWDRDGFWLFDGKAWGRTAWRQP